MRKRLLAVLLTLAATAGATVVVPLAKAKKACTVVVSMDAQKARYERAYIVAEREMPPEEAEPGEWWIYFPDRKGDRDEKGFRKTENVRKDEVLKQGEVRMIHGHACKCPPGMWDGGVTITAEH
jgi:hypothetical protein